MTGAAGLRVACLQLDGDGLGHPGRRREVAQEAAGALVPGEVDLVLLPELWPVGFFRPQDWAGAAEPADGPTAAWAASLARRLGAWVHAGSFVERAPAGPPHGTPPHGTPLHSTALHNTSLLLDPSGAVRLAYRKAHLFAYRSREAELLLPGDEVGVVDLDVPGRGAAAASLSTCFDLRFPEPYRLAVAGGADLLLVASAWPAARRDHWRLLCRARAVEAQAWLVACDGAGTDGGTALAGTSLVVDPWGEVVAEGAADSADVVRAVVDPARTAEVRGRYPFLAARRDDLRLAPGRHPASGRVREEA